MNLHVRRRGYTRGAWLAVLLALGLATPGIAQVRRVVLLYDERTDLPGLATLDARLVATLTAGSPGGVEIYREAMDLSRFPADRHRVLLRNYLRAGTVVHRARDLVKKGSSEPRILSVNEMVGEVLELARPDLQDHGVVSRTRLCSPAPRVFGDRVQLQQVLLNLIMNASDAMRDTRADQRLLIVSTATHGAAARIEIEDRGSGIAPDALETVFEPFVTTKRDGLGLGLSICRSIITAHHGSIRAHNNPEGGATFVISLPPTTGPLDAA